MSHKGLIRMSEYKFTTNWFQWSPDVWSGLVPLLPARKKFLEVGAFEGRSTVWTIEHMLEDGGTISSIDAWEDLEHEAYREMKMETVEERFDFNIGLVKKQFGKRKVKKLKGYSAPVLSGIVCNPAEHESYDFIYIDGSHNAPDVLTDACLAWPLLKRGGIMMFDDYLFGDARDVLHRPRIAIDAFVNIFAETLTVVHLGYQYAVRKD